MPNVINLDDAGLQESVVVVSHHGIKAAITKVRLLELLDREQQLLTILASGDAGSTAAPVVPPAPRVSALATEKRAPGPVKPPSAPENLSNEKVSHASLSSRIKKIFNYSKDKRALRPAHAVFLRELLAGFDWKLPPHPNTRLDSQLADIRDWKGVPREVRAEIDSFLERYIALRRD